MAPPPMASIGLLTRRAPPGVQSGDLASVFEHLRTTSGTKGGWKREFDESTKSDHTSQRPLLASSRAARTPSKSWYGLCGESSVDQMYPPIHPPTHHRSETCSTQETSCSATRTAPSPTTSFLPKRMQKSSNVCVRTWCFVMTNHRMHTHPSPQHSQGRGPQAAQCIHIHHQGHDRRAKAGDAAAP